MINILDIQVANIIAAGEVVDRPSSALKEILENAIDAKATSVVIEIKDGGVAFIRVKDNGIGMSLEDLSKSILRHATSKIKEAKDLESLVTLGFRGEALAAISAVSELRIFTKQEGSQTGYLMEVKGGKIDDIQEIGCSVGTTVIMEKIFYNLPARRKFLKSNTAEAMSCKWMTEKIALANPDVSFKLITDGKEKLFTQGKGEYSAVHSVFGSDIAGNLLIADEYELEGVKVRGYISKIEHGKATRTDQNFFVNGRFVRSRIIMTALEAAYKSVADTSHFPICVLYITIKENQLDVNVHPQKLEVKFSDDRKIYEAIYYAVKSTLIKKRSDESEMIYDSTETTESDNSKINVSLKKAGNIFDNIQSDQKVKENESLFFENYTDKNNKNANTVDIDVPYAELKEKTYEPKIKEAEVKETEIQEEENKEDKREEKEEREAEIRFGESYRVAGEIFFGYIIVEFSDKIILIDKHAAHERILYDELVRKLSERDKNMMQILLEPITFKLNEYCIDILVRYKNDIEKTGIIYSVDEENGNKKSKDLWLKGIKG